MHYARVRGHDTPLMFVAGPTVAEVTTYTIPPALRHRRETGDDGLAEDEASGFSSQPG